MRILQVHDRYTRQGGEETVASVEATLLRSSGHELKELQVSNAEVLSRGIVPTLRALANSPWNRESYRLVREAVRQFGPDVVHVQNFWWALSPSVFAAAKAEGVPTVLTLHNYRLVCPGALLMRGGRVCDRCVGRTPWRGVALGCYRGSATQTALVALMIDSNRRRGTWIHSVDVFLALSRHSRRVFVRGGLPADRICVKPNSLAVDPGPAKSPGEGALFVGRLSPEKGSEVLIEAWRGVNGPLEVVGNGPARARLVDLAERSPRVRLAGALAHREAIKRMKRASFLVIPSLWYECFPMVLLEAFACGKPVVASRLGAMAELVDHGRTGFLFEPGDPRDLAEKAQYLFGNPKECTRMGRAAREEFKLKYAPDVNYVMLIEIYEKAIETHRARRR